MPERVNGGHLLVVVGALALLVSLFLDWFEPGVTAWSVFELVDLLLAAIAVAALVGVVSAAAPGLGLPLLRSGTLLVLGLVAFILVAEALVNQPPAVAGRDPELGAWIALGGATLMTLGALLSVARVSLEITMAPRERRTERAAAEPPPAEPLAREPFPTESIPTEEHRVFPEDEPR
jgi:hypothetical protein